MPCQPHPQVPALLAPSLLIGPGAGAQAWSAGAARPQNTEVREGRYFQFSQGRRITVTIPDQWGQDPHPQGCLPGPRRFILEYRGWGWGEDGACDSRLRHQPGGRGWVRTARSLSSGVQAAGGPHRQTLKAWSGCRTGTQLPSLPGEDSGKCLFRSLGFTGQQREKV